MFYSHEILTSRQYGVATVWLVATIGSKSGARKVTRKDIQGVDVQRACGKILEPGAPIALRLQGNLLYGISRVHNQQYTYLIADAKKIQEQIKLSFGTILRNQLDYDEGEARPDNHLIENDPAFDPNMQIPVLNLDTLVTSQGNSQKTSSQMSPPQSSQFSGSQSHRKASVIQLNIDHSSLSSYHGSPFGLDGLSPVQNIYEKPPILPQDDDVFGAEGGWGFDVDEHGNIIELGERMVVDEEPQLPPLPPVLREDNMLTEAPQPDMQMIFDDQGDVIMHEKPLLAAEPFPEYQQHTPWQNDERPIRQALTHRKKKLQIDAVTQISRISAKQAKRNAMLLTFGLGIGNIGHSIAMPGLTHPLAVTFSGDALFTTITGIEVEKPQGIRRTASEAVEDSDQEEERRVRPRLTEKKGKQERPRGAQEDQFVNVDDPFADGAPTEVGRAAEHPMSDHLSSTLMPWNRGSSVVPGSSSRVPNLAQQGRDLSSPLGKRGDVQDIARYSDDAAAAGFGSDGTFDNEFGLADSFEGIQLPGRDPQEHESKGEPLTAQETQAQNDLLFEQLDKEGHNFMKFIQDAVSQDGERRLDADFDMGRKWLAFDDLFMPRDTPRLTAAQAFYHTLCLVTKNKMHVEQDGANQKPFGTIWIGAKVTAGELLGNHP
ncbi:hypothetical protein ONZ43_g2205 [Nemania bipapillata]|uniref:Uncharacterized protein n=1 Tax=Nemania bipapillata TaxID=110536 RepID=A0ACC2J1G8_9PEZI|nr:hypothetical protein ONZ43_g2205 [Nemania bipapillata]